MIRYNLTENKALQMTDVALTKKIFIVVIVEIILTDVIQTKLEFVKHNNYLYRVGKTQVFDCSVTIPANKTFTWVKDGKRISESDAFFRRNRQIMEIRDLSPRHSGFYKCVVRKRSNKLLERKFIIPPSTEPTIQHENTIINVTAGSTVKFKCVTGQYHITSYDWYFNGKKIQRNPNHHKVKTYKFLRLNKAAVSDTGQYTCSVQNAIGTSEVTYHLKVNPKAKTIADLAPQLINNDSLVMQVVEEKVKLDCLATGEEPMNITWFKNENPIGSKEAMRKAGSEYIFENNNHTILLQNIMLTDKGVFKCLVQNKYGSFVHNINLVPEESSAILPIFPDTQPKIFYVAPGRKLIVNVTLVAFGNTHFQLYRYYNKTINTTHSILDKTEINNAKMSYTHTNEHSGKAAERLKIRYEFTNVSASDYSSYFVRAGNSHGYAARDFQFTILEGSDKGPRPNVVALESDESWSKSNVFIALVSVGCVLLIVVIVIGLIYYYHSKEIKDNNNTTLLNMEEINIVLNIDKASEVTSVPSNRRLKFSTGRLSSCQTEKEYLYQGIPEDPEFEVDLDAIEFKRVLGEGAFGRVMLANVHGLLDLQSPTTVAVKMLKYDATERELKDLLSEIQVMKSMGRHENIVTVLGVSSQKGELCMIMEYCCFGNLRTFLKQRRPTRPPMPPPVEVLTRSNLISYCLQVAKGMDYLASKKCIHRDIAARNVLVADNYVVKIADFGLARDIQETDYYRKCTDGRLPVKWMAMEALFDRIYTTQSDIWSYGILTWEIVTFGGSPYPGVPIERLFELLKKGYRMEQPVNCSDKMYDLMLNCWKELPSQRPTFCEIITELERMLLDITESKDDNILQPPLTSGGGADSFSLPQHSAHSNTSVFGEFNDEVVFVNDSENSFQKEYDTQL